MTEGIFEQVLARRGTAGYRQYRIPALAVSTHGTILAAYDGRPNLDDLPNPIDLLLRRSTDGGRTWGAQQVVRTGTGLDGYGDPSLLVDAQTGRIFLFHAAGTQAGFFEAVEGLYPDDAVQHTDVSFSDDDGGTWTHRRLTAGFKREGITGLFAAAGQGIQIHTGPFTGRLVQQMVVLFHGEIHCASAYSDDHGETWTLGELVPGGNENKVACRDDGTLLLHTRATPFRMATVSYDGGHSYGTLAPVPELPDPSDNGSLSRWDGLPTVRAFAAPETAGWLLAANNQDADLRRNTVLSLSTDHGASWGRKLVLCEGSSAYSSAARLPNGNIGVLYERQGYQEIVFASVDPALLAGIPVAADAVASETQASGEEPEGALALDVVLRSITPGRPATWATVGESVALVPADGEWDASVFKEMGQAYSAAQPQILSNRESQDLNYGPVVPGFKAGDILAFSGRVANTNSQPVEAVVALMGAEGPLAAPQDLASGAKWLFTANYTVTEDDAAAAEFAVPFSVGAQHDGATIGSRRTFTFATDSGDVRES
ncbi:sialidase family protein [Arthrobacter sp. 35W]|uniref:sialidase family protein n=1 Tax=Arthrobacter sp. 35W TaxID=1132441 RepID=UPI0004274711|nr:sialidase family protein [Arthrobacter sp. 35W]